MRSPRQLVLIGLGVILCSGCVSQVATRVNTFRASGPMAASAAIAVTAQDTAQTKSLEFDFYKTRVEQALVKQGFRVANLRDAQYVAQLDYGVKRLDINKGSGMHTGFLTSGARGPVGMGAGVVVVDDNKNTPVFERKIGLVIAENNADAKRIYETTGVSEGACGVLSEVFDDMLAAVFAEFPAANGGSKTIKIKSSSACH